LNALLKEDRAIVSEIAGTTRDTIEESIVLDGIPFRLIDTAGLRDAADTIEAMGVKKTYEKIQSSAIVLFLFDLSSTSPDQLKADIAEFRDQNYHIIVLANKTDQLSAPELSAHQKAIGDIPILPLSAQFGQGIESLIQSLIQFARDSQQQAGSAIVTNSRHHAALTRAHEDLQRVLEGLQTGITGDFVAMDIRQALYHLGSITGEITTDDLLGNIFSNFCIGK
jgi:tRNA modification GTPase